MERVPADRVVIEQFVQLSGEKPRPGLTIEKWPEVENPGRSEIDAIAGDLAIEHTSVDSVQYLPRELEGPPIVQRLVCDRVPRQV